MRVRDLMEPEVVTLAATDTLDFAGDLMQLGRIRHLPVVAPGDRLVGILSQRDLFRAAVSSLLQFQHDAQRAWLAKIRVEAVMTPNVITIDPGAAIRQAVDLMLEHRIGCLPVVEAGRLVGLLSETDCLRHLAHVLDLGEVKERLPELAPAG
jgi:CBS domain-containing protein